MTPKVLWLECGVHSTLWTPTQGFFRVPDGIHHVQVFLVWLSESVLASHPPHTSYPELFSALLHSPKFTPVDALPDFPWPKNIGHIFSSHLSPHCDVCPGSDCLPPWPLLLTGSPYFQVQLTRGSITPLTPLIPSGLRLIISSLSSSNAECPASPIGSLNSVFLAVCLVLLVMNLTITEGVLSLKVFVGIHGNFPYLHEKGIKFSCDNMCQCKSKNNWHWQV